MLRAFLLATVVTGSAGCFVPGVGTVVEKSMAELRGGRGEARGIAPLPEGPALDRFRRVRILRVERSTDAGPIPDALPAVVESELRQAIDEARFFAGEKGPLLLIRTRLTTHWPATGFTQAVSAHSEILARVEFLEDGRRGPLGVYYVRGVSTAIARKSDEALGRGLALAVVEVIGSHRTPSPDTRLAEPAGMSSR